jgi:2-amino-4-hydroxy-6-hydroxymethyldihydropteridine diphosphokinase
MMQPSAIQAFVALGANLGNREMNLHAALRALDQAPGIHVVRASSFHETAAVGGPTDSPPYLNAVAEIHTSLEPDALLQRLLEIEKSLGRIRREKWEPRLIDLDLLLYGDRVIVTDALSVPHPLLHARAFVLDPLAEIAPELVHPVLGKTIRQLRAAKLTGA